MLQVSWKSETVRKKPTLYQQSSFDLRTELVCCGCAPAYEEKQQEAVQQAVEAHEDGDLCHQGLRYTPGPDLSKKINKNCSFAADFCKI